MKDLLNLLKNQGQIEEFDAIILDLGLPGMDGHTFLTRLRARDDRTPVLVLTARDSLAERIDTLHEDLVSVLWKNRLEAAGGGSDPDKNGYAGDIHGWNFLGADDPGAHRAGHETGAEPQRLAGHVADCVDVLG